MSFRNKKFPQQSRISGFIPSANEPHVSVTDLSSAVTLNVPKGVGSVMLQALTQNVIFTLDGSTPTATHGFDLVAGESPIVIDVSPNTTFRFLQNAGGSVLQYQYGES